MRSCCNCRLSPGTTAQSLATQAGLAKVAWNDTNAYSAHVELSLSGFNTSLPAPAIELYNKTSKGDNWHAYTSMLSDIRVTCPLHKMATQMQEHFQAIAFYSRHGEPFI